MIELLKNILLSIFIVAMIVCGVYLAPQLVPQLCPPCESVIPLLSGGVTNLTSLTLSDDLVVGDDTTLSGDLGITTLTASAQSIVTAP